MGGDLAMSQNIVISHSATIPASLPRKAGLQVKLSAGCRCLAVSDRLLESSARAGWSSGHTFGNGGIFPANPQLRSYFRRSSGPGKDRHWRTSERTGRYLACEQQWQARYQLRFSGLITNRFGIDAGVIVVAIAVQRDDKILALATGFQAGIYICHSS